jgi:hemolysin-activating ACP:hemolysin acyltransferase
LFARFSAAMSDVGRLHVLRTGLLATSNEEYERRARILGEVWAIKVLCRQLAGGWLDLQSLYDPAIRHHRIRVFYNSLADPVGYVVWAHLAPDVERRWMTAGTVRLHLSEWTEGTRLWLIDGMVARGYVADAIESALDELFPHEASVCLAKRRGNAVVFKEYDRAGLRAAARRLRSQGD